MPKFDRKEFIEMLGGAMDGAKLRVNIQRGNVIEADGEIDDKNETNKLFIAKHKAKPAQPTKQPRNKKEKKAPRKRTARPKRQALPLSVDDGEDPSLFDDETLEDLKKLNLTDLEKAKKAADILRQRKAYDLDRLKEARLQGKVVPTDMVKDIFNVHFKNVTDEFYQAADNIVTMINQRVGGTREDMVKMRSELKGKVNQAVHLAKEASKKDVLIIVEDFSEALKRTG